MPCSRILLRRTSKVIGGERVMRCRNQPLPNKISVQLEELAIGKSPGTAMEVKYLIGPNSNLLTLILREKCQIYLYRIEQMFSRKVSNNAFEHKIIIDFPGLIYAGHSIPTVLAHKFQDSLFND